jgi:hypothetical protein
MQILAKARVAILLVMVVSSAALFAQSGGSAPDQTQTHASVPDAGVIVSTSIAATEHSWEARGYYTYTERDENRRLDAAAR